MIFRNWVLQNFPFLEDDFDALTDYELFCKMMEYVKQFAKDNEEFRKRIEDLENYIYNLDLQDEVDKKLDEMAESGELTDIIAQYLDLAGVLAYNTKADMKLAENIANGSILKTLGNTTYNDGLGNFYKARTITSGDTIDDDNIVALYNDTLIAEKIPNNYIGDLTDLDTTNKSSIVDAINEVNSRTNTHKYLYGIIRPTSEGWTILSDSTHVPVNLDSVEINNGALLLRHNHSFSKVNSFQITPDETFCKYGISAGASVGLNSSTVEIYQNLRAGGYIRTNTGTPVIQTNYSNLIDSVSFSTNHLIVVFNEDLTGLYPNEWTAEFAGVSNATTAATNKTKHLQPILISNRRLDIYCLLSDNSFSTDITDFDKILVYMNYCNKINPSDLVTNPISGANFWIEGIFE